MSEESIKQHDPVMDLLQQVVALSAQDQSRLRGALQAVSRDVWISEPGPAVTAGGDSFDHADAAAFAQCEAWLKELSIEPAREQMQKLHAAMQEEDLPEIHALMAARLAVLKNENKREAALMAVFDYAYQHPFMSLIAVGGTGVAIYRLSKGAFNLVF